MAVTTSQELVARAAGGDVEAFAELVRAHQAAAFGAALAILRDFHLAQDATQEAFVTAYFGLARLRDRAKFAAWLRGIVRHQCRRIQRRRGESLLDEALALTLAAPGTLPEGWAEEREATDVLLAAIATLPEALRAPARLAFVEDRPQREVAAILGLPLTTVNNRLYAARRRLHERRLATMTDDGARALPADFAATVVELIRSRGSMVDLRFPEPPPLLSLVEIGDRSGNGSGVQAGVVQQLPDGATRCLVLTPAGTLGASGTRHGVSVRVHDAPPTHGATPGAIRRAVDALDRPAGDLQLLETGLKAIDLLCPIPRGGVIGLFGDAGAGKAVLVGELLHNLAERDGLPEIFAFIEPGEETAFMHRRMPRVSAADPIMQAMYVVSEQAQVLAAPELADAFTAIVVVSREIVGLRIFPAIDPARSSSRLLVPEIVGEEHCGVAREVRDLLARFPLVSQATSEGYPTVIEPKGEGYPTVETLAAQRARRLRRFLGQPMFMATDFTQLPGQAVPLAETLRGCTAILRGECDDLPLEAFWMVGTVDEAREKAAKLARREA